MGDFSLARNSKFTGIIKLKLTYLVPVFISLLLSQFQRAPLDITLPVSSGAHWNCDSSKEINTGTRYVSLSFIIPVNFEFHARLKSPIHFLIILHYDIWPPGAWAACGLTGIHGSSLCFTLNCCMHSAYNTLLYIINCYLHGLYYSFIKSGFVMQCSYLDTIYNFFFVVTRWWNLTEALVLMLISWCLF